MDQRDVHVNLPDWLRRSVQQGATVWGVPANYVHDKVDEVGAKRRKKEAKGEKESDARSSSTRNEASTSAQKSYEGLRPEGQTPPHNNTPGNMASREAPRSTVPTPKAGSPQRDPPQMNSSSLPPPGNRLMPPSEHNETESQQYVPKPLPEWYTKIEPTSWEFRDLNRRPTPDHSQYVKALASMKSCIERCENGQGDFNELRDHVHKAEIQLKVNRFIVRKTRMLEEPYGLPRIFASTKMDVPVDLKMDAWQLYLRWYNEDFEVDILRGIHTRKGKDRNADSIDSKWKKIWAKYYGEGDLVLGQWWPTQLCLVRDGAHGSAQGGIYGEKGFGAYSIVLSGAGAYQYQDEDNGDTLWYSGTDSKGSVPTENTLRMIESCDKVKNKVRVFRSHMLPKKNPYRPVVGMRYDGLYTVERAELVDLRKQAFRFFLVRCPGQPPIRYGDNAAARPTIYEIEEDEKLRRFGR